MLLRKMSMEEIDCFFGRTTARTYWYYNTQLEICGNFFAVLVSAQTGFYNRIKSTKATKIFQTRKNHLFESSSCFAAWALEIWSHRRMDPLLSGSWTKSSMFVWMSRHRTRLSTQIPTYQQWHRRLASKATPQWLAEFIPTPNGGFLEFDSIDLCRFIWISSFLIASNFTMIDQYCFVLSRRTYYSWIWLSLCNSKLNVFCHKVCLITIHYS